VTVSYEPHADEFIIIVMNNGIGIPKSAQTHIFDRIYRTNNAINIEEHGTGLGLYLPRTLVTALGGRV
jgi:signal transduction histidine kinase